MHSFTNNIHIGDCRALMRQMIAAGVKVQCIVTSPPYFGLRNYQVAGQYGSESTWIRHVARMRSVFRLARQLLADDGTLWLNYGDSYSSAPGGHQGKNGQRANRAFSGRVSLDKRRSGLKSKDLIGMPWRVAFALQADDWYLRQDIIWSKPNPMPESIRDRCTKAHEYMFLFSKSQRYYWDFEAMQEEVSGTANPRRAAQKTPDGWDTRSGVGGHGSFHRVGREKGHLPGNKTHSGADAYEAGDEHHRTKGGLVTYSRKLADAASGIKNNDSMDAALSEMRLTRNKRSVWTVPSQPFKEAHFATFPRALIEPCILAGSRPGDIILDPFMGSGTVAETAQSLGRKYIGIELNPAYAAMFKNHRSQQQGMAI
jgi:site-specific DNA-methyltransferase (cytosine-N4-specific)